MAILFEDAPRAVVGRVAVVGRLRVAGVVGGQTLVDVDVRHVLFALLLGDHAQRVLADLRHLVTPLLLATPALAVQAPPLPLRLLNVLFVRHEAVHVVGRHHLLLIVVLVLRGVIAMFANGQIVGNEQFLAGMSDEVVTEQNLSVRKVGQVTVPQEAFLGETGSGVDQVVVPQQLMQAHVHHGVQMVGATAMPQILVQGKSGNGFSGLHGCRTWRWEGIVVVMQRFAGQSDKGVMSSARWA